MTASIIELNDQEVRLARDNEIVVRSRGAAIVTNSGVEVGSTANQQVHLNPRDSYQKFWYQLNQAALRSPSKSARHHADLAYLHLLQVLTEGGKPEKVVLAIPGGFSKEQLGLLLGIIHACGVEVIAMVDAAVAEAASCAGSGEYCHVEMQKYRTVITHLTVDEQVVRHRLDVLDDIGTEKISRLLVEFIADQFLVQSRFDPLHQANTEQILFNEIPNWIDLLRKRKETDIHIEFRQRRFDARLKRSAVVELLDPVYDEIREQLTRREHCLIGSRLARLPGFNIQDSRMFLLPETAVFEGCRDLLRGTGDASKELRLQTNLPASTEPTIGNVYFATPNRETSDSARIVTHILCKGTAYPVTSASSYFSDVGQVSAVEADNSVFQIWQKGSGLLLRRCHSIRVSKNDTPVDVETTVEVGDRITSDRSKFVFEPIHVVGINAR
jgi:hypothetical protein